MVPRSSSGECGTIYPIITCSTFRPVANTAKPASASSRHFLAKSVNLKAKLLKA